MITSIYTDEATGEAMLNNGSWIDSINDFDDDTQFDSDRDFQLEE